MLLQEPAQSPYDLRFNLFGFSVRIAWTFWLAGLVFGFSLARYLDEGVFATVSPGLLPLLLLWTLCLLVSILIHELGHAFAFRRYGIESTIVLYHFGGLAIPTDSFSPGRSYQQLTPKQDILVSLAGPIAQMLSALVVIGAVKAAGYSLWVFTIMPGPFYKI
ncbi:MAG: site-2 protease family protein, partial [Rubripirellula sp.]